MARKLIVPDIHNEWQVIKTFLEKYGEDFEERYFLGDFFDDFDDNPYIAMETAKFIKWLLDDPRNNLCMGNHDVPYRYPYNRTVSCPGWTVEKSLEVGKVLDFKDWEKIKLAYWVDNWMLSHAGIHPYFFGFPRVELDITPELVFQVCNKAIEKMEVNSWHSIMMAGMDRGFHGQMVGGITWLDWEELMHIPNLNQIVGHTPNRYPQFKAIDRNDQKYEDASFKYVDRDYKCISWCLDSEARATIGILEDGKLKVILRDDYV